VAPWRGETMKEWKAAFIKKVAKDFPIHKPYFQLTKEQRQFLWRGDKTANFPGVDNFFKMLEENLYIKSSIV
jgi:excinuclease ABC subunit A